MTQLLYLHINEGTDVVEIKVSVVGDYLCPSAVATTGALIAQYKENPSIKLMLDRSESVYENALEYYCLIGEIELSAVEQSDVVIIDVRDEASASYGSWVSGFCWANGIRTILLCGDAPFNVSHVCHDDIVTSIEELNELLFFEYVIAR